MIHDQPSQSRKKIARDKLVDVESGQLTLSCRGYHLRPGVSNTSYPRGRVTSPRKSFLPNMSECHTESHRVRVVTSDTVIVYFNVSSKDGFNEFFFTLVFLFPFLLRSGRRYTFTYLGITSRVSIK